MKLTKYQGDPTTESVAQHVQRTRLDAEIQRFKDKRAIAHGEGDKGIQAPAKTRVGRAFAGPTKGKYYGRTVGEEPNDGLVNQAVPKKRTDYYQDPSTFELDPSKRGPAPYGMREDDTPKGEGYFGQIKRLDNPAMFSTELSASTDFAVDGRPVLFPLLVPTLSRDEIELLVSGKEPTPDIYKKAETFARQRISKGLSPFAGTGEQGKLPDVAQDSFRAGFLQEQVP